MVRLLAFALPRMVTEAVCYLNITCQEYHLVRGFQTSGSRAVADLSQGGSRMLPTQKEIEIPLL